MPKSRRRKVNGRPVRMTTKTPGALVARRHVEQLCNDLDDLMREVPTAYNPTSMAEAVEHHHRASAVIAFLREHRLTDVLAAMAGGDMVIVEDEAARYAAEASTPTGEADIVQSLKASGASLDMAGALAVGAIGQRPRVHGPGPIPRTAEELAERLAFTRTEEYPRRTPGMSYAELVAAQVPATVPPEAAPDAEGWSSFATDTATLERIASGAWVSDTPPGGFLPVTPLGHGFTIEGTAPEPAPGLRQARSGALTRGPGCTACGADVARYTNGHTRRHKDPATRKWCVGS